VTDHSHSTRPPGGRRGLEVVVDCATCPARGLRCDDCMVTALLSMPPADLPLDAAERLAVTRLVSAGLVTAETAASARARSERSGGRAAAG
jgi:hypothetical protein